MVTVILKCDNSGESFKETLLRGAVYYAAQGDFTFSVQII